MESSILFAVLKNLIIWTGEELFNPSSSRLLEYLAEGNEKSLELMFDRQPYPDPSKIKLGIQAHKTTVYQVRFDLMHNCTRAYEIAIRVNPTLAELEEFSSFKACWSILFPLKKYLIEHTEHCRNYRGLFPLGSDVLRFMKEIWPDWKLGTSPSHGDHIQMRDLTVQLANITGLTPIMINHIMYVAGAKLSGNKNAA